MYSRSAAVPAGVCCLGNPPATNLFPHTHTLPAIEKQNTADSMNKDSLNKKKERGRTKRKGEEKRSKGGRGEWEGEEEEGTEKRKDGWCRGREKRKWKAQKEVYLLPSKDVLVEVKLQLFIGNVDTQLLKWVGTKVLKTKNVQNANIQQLCGTGGRDEKKEKEREDEGRMKRGGRKKEEERGEEKGGREKRWQKNRTLINIVNCISEIVFIDHVMSCD